MGRPQAAWRPSTPALVAPGSAVAVGKGGPAARQGKRQGTRTAAAQPGSAGWPSPEKRALPTRFIALWAGRGGEVRAGTGRRVRRPFGLCAKGTG